MTEVGSCRKPFAARSKLRRLARQFSQTKSWREATRAAAYADIYFLPRGALPETGVSHRRALYLSLFSFRAKVDKRSDAATPAPPAMFGVSPFNRGQLRVW